MPAIKISNEFNIVTKEEYRKNIHKQILNRNRNSVYIRENIVRYHELDLFSKHSKLALLLHQNQLLIGCCLIKRTDHAK